MIAGKLAIVMPRFYEQLVGGSEYQAYLLAEAARSAGHQVHYIFVSTGIPCSNHLDIILHPMVPFVVATKRFGATWSIYYWRISRLLNMIRPSVVYVRGGWSFAAMTAWYARWNRCRSVWHVASSNDVTPSSNWRCLHRPFEIVERKSVEYAIRRTEIVVCHAHSQAEMLEKYYGRASYVILKEQPEPREKLDKSGPTTVVWIGNIKKVKQPRMFVLLARAFQDDTSVRFVMVGRRAYGGFQEELDREIGELSNLAFLGELTMEGVNELLARSHILVNTSLYEGLPNTFVQSWMRGVPVVSMLLDPDDILKTEMIGFVSGSLEQMVVDIRFLVDNPGVRRDFGERARAYALENHSLKRNMGHLLDLIFH